jgi:hypothetical protein
MRYSKKEMSALFVFCVITIFSIFVVEKLIRIKISPDTLLVSEKNIPKNIEIEELGKEDFLLPVTKDTSYIFVVKNIEGKKTYELITPGMIHDHSEFKDGIKIEDEDKYKKAQNFLLQIVSGSGDAYAGRCKKGQPLTDCSGTYVDGTAYVESKCWCK